MEEKSIVYSNNVPSKYKDKLLGEGACGKCYLTKDNMVFKYMHKTSRDLYDSISSLTKYRSELIAFPKSLMFYRSENENGFRGYLMDFFEGEILDNIDDVDLYTFLCYLEMLEKEIINVSYDGVTLFDLNQSNILYSEKYGLRIIDTDLYETNLYKSKLFNKECNLVELNQAIVRFIFNSAYTRFRDEKLDSRFRSCGLNNGINTSDFIYEFIEYINKNRKTNVKTLRQLRNKGFNYYHV